MREEEKIFAGKMFDPRRQELKDIKHAAHEACQKFNQTDEYDPARQELLRNILAVRPSIAKVRSSLITGVTPLLVRISLQILILRSWMMLVSLSEIMLQ